jgi:hypothetical protein
MRCMGSDEAFQAAAWKGNATFTHCRIFFLYVLSDILRVANGADKERVEQ